MKNKRKPNKILANRVRELRKAENMTQSDLGKALHFTEKYIGDMENCRRSITEQTADLMANIFNVDRNYLLDDSVKYKSTLDHFYSVSEQSAQENALMFAAIIRLAELHGYRVKLNDYHQSDLKTVFHNMKNYMVFMKDDKEVLALSLADANNLGNVLSSVFQSNIDLIAGLKGVNLEKL